MRSDTELRKPRSDIPRARSAVFIEMTIASLVFFSFTVGTMAVGVAYYFSGCLSHTLAEAARWGILGETIGELSRIESIEQVVINNGNLCGLNFAPNRDGETWIGPDNPHIQICSEANFECWQDKNSDSVGSAGMWSMYRASHIVNLPLIPKIEVAQRIFKRSER